MPGVYGYIKRFREDNQLKAMTKILYHNENFIKEDDFNDDTFAYSHIHLGNMKSYDGLFFRDGIYIAVEGEQYDYKNINFEDLIFKAYTENNLDSFLNKLDGYFNAMIYDSIKKKVFLISDRYGLRMLYFYYKDGNFAFSGEVKGLLGLDFVNKEFDGSQIDIFMNVGHLLEDNTWYKYIKLMRPATIMELDIDSSGLTQKYYWKWSEIKPSNIGFDDAVDRLGEIWLKAVKKRFNQECNVGVLLSGGLDSRAIFAAINKLYPKYEGVAYTFGISNCDDIKIAKQCIEQTKWKHKEFYFTNNNWFEPRKNRIWFTDGMLNLKHMHGSEFFKAIGNDKRFIIGGVFGDIILRFTSLQGKDAAYDKRVNNELAQLFYKGYSNQDFIMDSFYNINNCDPFTLMNDGRRFSNMGVFNTSDSFDFRVPFFDNALIEFIYSVSDSYRKDNRLYSSMLLKFFPEFFKYIPWANTGKTIDKKMSSNKIMTILKKIKRIPYKMGLLYDGGFVDYLKWIEQKEVKKELNDLLDPGRALYSKYTNVDFKFKYLNKKLKGIRKYDEMILRAATIEIYLRKLDSLNLIDD